MGNCNPKRCITYEKYLMDQVLTLVETVISLDRVASFSNDEIVLDVSDLTEEEQMLVQYQINTLLSDKKLVLLQVKLFTLHKITCCGKEGYVKEELAANGPDSCLKVKCVEPELMPFVIRYLCNESVRDEDKIFMHNGILSKCIEIPFVYCSAKELN